MRFHEQDRSSGVTLSPSLLLRFAQDKAQGKLREGSRSLGEEMLRFAQHDIPGVGC
jgi:hypothetical protein